MACRDEILEAFTTLTRRTGRDTFTPAEIVSEMQRNRTAYADSTIRTHITSHICVNAPDHHAMTYRDLQRLETGSYRLVG